MEEDRKQEKKKKKTEDSTCPRSEAWSPRPRGEIPET